MGNDAEQQPAPSRHVNYGRKAWHLAGGMAVVILLVRFAPSKLPAIGILVFAVAVLAALDIWRWRSARGDRFFWKHLGFLASEKEKRGPTTSLYYAASLLVSVLIFPRYAAIGAVLSLAAGDSTAAIIGRRWGKVRIAGKSIEGALANALVSFILIRVFVPSTALAAAGALAGAIIEVVPFRHLDDNITVPLAAGCAMLAAAALMTG
jgi:dolichol kinase